MKKVLISLDELLQVLHSGHTIPSLTKWFDAQPDASNLNKIITAYEQATDISPEELDIGDENDD